MSFQHQTPTTPFRSFRFSCVSISFSLRWFNISSKKWLRSNDKLKGTWYVWVMKFTSMQRNFSSKNVKKRATSIEVRVWMCENFFFFSIFGKRVKNIASDVVLLLVRCQSGSEQQHYKIFVFWFDNNCTLVRAVPAHMYSIKNLHGKFQLELKMGD